MCASYQSATLLISVVFLVAISYLPGRTRWVLFLSLFIRICRSLPLADVQRHVWHQILALLSWPKMLAADWITLVEWSWMTICQMVLWKWTVTTRSNYSLQIYSIYWMWVYSKYTSARLACTSTQHKLQGWIGDPDSNISHHILH